VLLAQTAFEDADARLKVGRRHFHLDVKSPLSDRRGIESVEVVGCADKDHRVTAQLVHLGEKHTHRFRGFRVGALYFGAVDQQRIDLIEKEDDPTLPRGVGE